MATETAVRAPNSRDESALSPIHVLVVDDDLEIGRFIAAAAQRLRMRCTATTNAADFLAALDSSVSLIITDLMMPYMDGIEVLRALAQARSSAAIVLMSGFDARVLQSAEDYARSAGLAVVGRLQKPFRLLELEALLRTRARAASTPIAVLRAPMAIAESDLRRGIDRNEMLLHYQPQIEIKTHRVVGVEALVRWQHPVRGLVYPDAFIGLAEREGLIDQLGWLVVQRGLTEIGTIAGTGSEIPKLAVNVSAYSLHDVRFPDRLVAMADRCNVPRAKIVVEITESGLTSQLASALDVLTRLRMKEVHLSIDDFGTGYATLQQLRHVPATELKIDRTFVHELPVMDRARVMVQKTIELAHELGLTVVAEGVETLEQFDFLEASGCDRAQGYLMSRPLPVGELVRWLDRPH